MDKILKHYKRIFEKLWLSLLMASKGVHSSDKTKEGSCSGTTLSTKPGYVDLTASQDQLTKNEGNWEDVEDRILRVLSYKYYDCDLKLIYLSNNYLLQSHSTFCLEEEEVETLYLQDFSDIIFKSLEVEVDRSFLPILEQPELINFNEDSTCVRMWKCIKNMFTLKHCREP